MSRQYDQFSMELGKICGSRMMKCYPNLNENNMKEPISELEDIRMSVLDFGYDDKSFVIRPEIFNYFNHHFNDLPQNEETFKRFCMFIKRIFNTEDDNFFYQKMMDYIRSYVHLREASNMDLNQIEKYAVSERLNSYDADLRKYYDSYQQAQSIYSYDIEDKYLLDEIIIFVYTYLYVNGYDNDITDFIENINIEKIIEDCHLLDINKENMRSNIEDDNSFRKIFIAYLKRVIKENKKKKDKVLVRDLKREHVYI